MKLLFSIVILITACGINLPAVGADTEKDSVVDLLNLPPYEYRDDFDFELKYNK